MVNVAPYSKDSREFDHLLQVGEVWFKLTPCDRSALADLDESGEVLAYCHLIMVPLNPDFGWEDMASAGIDQGDMVTAFKDEFEEIKSSYFSPREGMVTYRFASNGRGAGTMDFPHVHFYLADTRLFSQEEREKLGLPRIAKLTDSVVSTANR